MNHLWLRVQVSLSLVRISSHPSTAANTCCTNSWGKCTVNHFCFDNNRNDSGNIQSRVKLPPHIFENTRRLTTARLFQPFSKASKRTRHIKGPFLLLQRHGRFVDRRGGDFAETIITPSLTLVFHSLRRSASVIMTRHHRTI